MKPPTSSAIEAPSLNLVQLDVVDYLLPRESPTSSILLKGLLIFIGAR